MASVEGKNNITLGERGRSFQLIVSRETKNSAEAEVNWESWGNQLILDRRPGVANLVTTESHLLEAESII